MPPTKKNALLLLEDFDGMRNILGRSCSKAGFQVVSTGSLDGAVTVAKVERPEVVIFDFSMKMEDDPFVAITLLHEILPESKLIILHRSGRMSTKKLHSLGVTDIITEQNIKNDLDRILLLNAKDLNFKLKEFLNIQS